PATINVMYCMMKGVLRILIIISMEFTSALAQKTITTYHKDSTIILTRDERLDQLIARQKDNNTLKQTMAGYRIQIYFGGMRQKAIEVKSDFSVKHPEV